MTVSTIIEEMVRDASFHAEKETQYLLNSPETKKQLLNAINSTDEIPLEEARESEKRHAALKRLFSLELNCLIPQVARW